MQFSRFFFASVSEDEVCEKCAVPENILQKGGGGRVGSSVRPKNLKKCMKLSWNFQRDGGVLEKSLP